jgi:hypothetical protein
MNFLSVFIVNGNASIGNIKACHSVTLLIPQHMYLTALQIVFV